MSMLPCIMFAGALDGKHVLIQASTIQGSDFFNYKQLHSINLMDICDAVLEFTFIDVDQPGCWSDSGVFEVLEILCFMQ